MPKSYSAGMNVEFVRPPTLRAAAAALITDGWSPIIDGCIQFLPARTPYRTGWEYLPADCWPLLLDVLEENENEGTLNRLLMRFKKTPFDAVLEFFQGGGITVDCGPLLPTGCCRISRLR